MLKSEVRHHNEMFYHPGVTHIEVNAVSTLLNRTNKNRRNQNVALQQYYKNDNPSMFFFVCALRPAGRNQITAIGVFQIPNRAV